MLFGYQDSTPQTPQDNASVSPTTAPSVQDDALKIDPTADIQASGILEDIDAPVTQVSALNQPSASAPVLATESAQGVQTIPGSSGGEDLLELKQQALTELTPLVSHLDQTPEEKFRTTMMMIQSADNAALIKEAYAAAQQISDEKARAQALLDVVNEINYFTHKNDA